MTDLLDTRPTDSPATDPLVIEHHSDERPHDAEALPGCPVCDDLMADADDSGPYVTIRVALPNGTVTPFSVGCESDLRADALAAFLAEHGIESERTR